MASMDFKSGQIRERAKGSSHLSYYIPKTSKPFMKECLKAHNLLVSLLGNINLSKEEFKTTVLRYVALDDSGKQELIKKLVMQGYEQKPNFAKIADIAYSWMEQKIVESHTYKQKQIIKHHKDVILKFFEAEGITTTTELNYDIAHKYIKWRSSNNFGIYGNNPTSASTIKHEIQVLRQMAKVAARNGFLPNGNLWDDVKIKAIAGINKKVVEPLTIEMQMDLLKKLKNTPHHDIALFLLISGIRIGELGTLNPNSIQNGVLTLHGEGIGNDKPISGKTASASRTLPVCPTMKKLFERGEMFKTNRNAFRLALNRNFKGIHAHRLRHTFAVNKLLSQVPLQMVSYQMGHNKTDITANLYGKFVPEHFKAGFEETIRIRKDFVKWLEQDYFKLS